jgi:hypothetical protein
MFLREDGEWALVDGAPEIVGKRENIFFFCDHDARRRDRDRVSAITRPVTFVTSSDTPTSDGGAVP